MPWDEQDSLEPYEASIDRLNMAGPLLGATGWIDELAQLVAVDTSVPAVAGCDALAALLQDQFAPLGFDMRRIPLDSGPVDGPRLHLVAARRTGRPICTIPLLMDTAAPNAHWTRPPLTLTRQGSRLYGLGTVSMKGAIAAVWAALRVADAVGLKLRFDPLLLFTTDGAARRWPGLRHLAEQRVAEGHVLWLNGPVAPRIWAGSLGSLDLEIEVSDCAASRTGEAGSAAKPILEALSRLQSDLRRRTSRLPAPPDAGGGMLRPKLSVVSVRGDESGASPDCKLLVQRSFTAEEGYAVALQELRSAVASGIREAPGCKVESRVSRRLEPVVDPDHGPNWSRWLRALSWGFGFSPNSFRRWGGAGGSAIGFMQQAGIREILAGGLLRRGQRLHGADEHTTVEDVEALSRAVLAYLADVPQIPDYS
ncbi:M20 family metallopeptidase [Teichococcus vastitatis]|jgi:succinyl-diaminopimelate desuccinylase|uniref:M20/M25/M40 family metallo-hydrolase n=1 Tax=Teichococcus vastitatis TaxID=2307076 RepID=A0ABS9W1U9_9PROT|nr:M20/M25/M40 family metallo-hydrolase [Pseudoroseomonas vastitatis]MCI0753163.1 M20/M25/M40 family metallo-hydrolase [Pseudoroseomonas vastitatis]